MDWAENGSEAVDQFEASDPGSYFAIFMDMQMPVMDVTTAARTIRKLDHPQAREITIIAVTANAYHEDIQKCLKAGMNEHLAKPVDYQKLTDLLKKLCR